MKSITWRMRMETLDYQTPRKPAERGGPGWQGHMSVWLAAAAICLIFLSLQFREIGDALGPIVIVCALAGLIFGGVSFVLYGASWQSISGMLVCFPLVYLAGLELITRF